jgi:thiamine kinase-like enzyme
VQLSTELMQTLESALGRSDGTAEPLEGGITNRNFRMRFGSSEYVVRLCGKETERLGIDRAAEVQATRFAHTVGVAPEVVAFVPEHDCVVTRWVPGRPATPEEVRDPGRLRRIGQALRAVHRGPELPVKFNTFRLAESYREQTVARGGTVPAAYESIRALMGRIESVLTGEEHRPVPCHNDLLTANFLVGPGEALNIVDWEYAGMGDRYFDLGNLAVNNGLDEEDEQRLLAAYWDEPPDERRRAALSLMRLVSDFREATWGMVQGVVSELDFDFAGYMTQHFDRLLGAAEDPRLERWLDAAAS